MNVRMLDGMLDERVQTRKFVKHAEKMLDQMLDWFAPAVRPHILLFILEKRLLSIQRTRQKMFIN